MNIPYRFAPATLLLACVLASPVHAEVVLEMQVSYYDEIDSVHEVEINELLVRSGRLAIRNADGEIESIYEQATNTLYSIDHDSRSYTALDRDSVQHIAAEVDAAMEEMRRQLDAMPPQQREMAERMMSQAMGGMSMEEREEPGERSVAATGRSGEAAGIRCDWYDVMENGEQVGTACVAPQDQVPGGDELVAMLTAMGAFYDELLAELSGRIPMALPPNPIMPLAELGGLPILSTEQRPGEEATETELLDVRMQEVDDSVFEIPSGYRRETLGQ